MYRLNRQDSPQQMANAKPWRLFTVLSVIALMCVSCSNAPQKTSSSQGGRGQSSHITKGATLPLTDSVPPQADATSTASVSTSTSILTPTAIPMPLRVPISAGPTPTPVVLQTTTVDDSVQGTGINQFNYVGSGWSHCTSGCGAGSPNPYDNSISLDTTTGDYVTISFTGVQIKFYSQLSVKYQGNEIITIDGGSKTTVSSHSTTNEGDYLLWTSPMLPAGTHTFQLSVAPGSSTNNCVIDRVDILS